MKCKACSGKITDVRLQRFGLCEKHKSLRGSGDNPTIWNFVPNELPDYKIGRSGDDKEKHRGHNQEIDDAIAKAGRDLLRHMWQRHLESINAVSP